MYFILPCIIRKIQTKEIEKDGQKIPMITVQYEQESFKQNGESYIELGSMTMPEKYKKVYQDLVGKAKDIPVKVFSPKDSTKVYCKFHEMKGSKVVAELKAKKDDVPF